MGDTILGRKFVGMLVLLVWLVFYIAFAAWLAVAILPRNVFLELPFYAVAGIAWAFPARYLILWMNRPMKTKSGPIHPPQETDPSQSEQEQK